MRTRWHAEQSLWQALRLAMRSVVRPMWIFAICASIEVAVAQIAAKPQPVLVAGKTNVQGQCKIISVAPNPDSPASERPAVFVGPADGRPEKIARPNQIVQAGNSIHTFRGGTALLELSSGTLIHLAENSELRIDRALEDGSFWLYLKVGAVRLLGLASDKTLMQSPSALATRHHTDFEMRVSHEGSTEVTVFEGVVELTNSFGRLRLDGASATNRATVLRGSAPVPVLRATNVVQWWLHFPVVLDPTELSLPLDAVRDLDDSLREYARGRYREAVVLYPEARQPTSDQERIYAAALRLVAGDLPAAEAILEQVKTMSENAAALKLLISAVRRDVHSEPIKPTTASGWLSLSYWHQARHELAAALRAAYQSANYSQKFIAAWARVTELELGREDVRAAKRSLDHLKTLAPDHSLTWMLEGFLSLADNMSTAAAERFEAALSRDPASADAWFGLALARIRQGRRNEGLAALETAVAIEPERSLLRSYLAKAFALNGRNADASVQIKEAEALDPGDPTPWLYAAWFDYEQNRINPATTNLQHSIERNDNLQLFRSRAQLDHDRSVRVTSLARLYERAGMPEVALREAARAVAFDYSNPSAHLFLADSFNALRDPTRFNLRYETAWFNELLLANALAPVEAGILTPSLSQQEYTRLFARDGLRLSSFGEVRSDGQYRQLATQSGVFGRTAYALDLDYQHNNGVRINNDLESLELYTQLKQQVTDADTAMLLLKFEEYESGDNFQYLNPTNARPAFRYTEEQHPIAYSIWRHDWSPGSHTLAAFGRLENQQHFTDQANQSLLQYDRDGKLIPGQYLPLGIDYSGRLEIWTGEFQQIVQTDRHTIVAGARVQGGEFVTADKLTGNPSVNPTVAPYLPFFGDSRGVFHQGEVTEDFRRITVYGYETWKVFDQFAVTFGLAWEELKFPTNFRAPPLTEGTDERARLLPKAALVWNPTDAVTIRGMYGQSLGGVSLDESYRLEPVQLAGFSQSFRTVIPESLVSSVSAHDLNLGGAALDVKLPTRTYLGLQGTITESAVDREIGVFQLHSGVAQPGGIAQIQEQLRYREVAVQGTIHQLIGDYWSVGLAYGYTRASLDRTQPSAAFTSRERAGLHSLRCQGVFNLPEGFFAAASSLWLWQNDHAAVFTDESHVQIDLECGWRFPRQFGEFSIGVLNLLDKDYRLAPLSGLPELPRERVFLARLRLNF